jgi:hypothetical protein
MARDETSQDMIETILHSFVPAAKTGDMAEAIYEQIVEPLELAASDLLHLNDGLPMTGIEASRRIEKMRSLLTERGLR